MLGLGMGEVLPDRCNYASITIPPFLLSGSCVLFYPIDERNFQNSVYNIISCGSPFKSERALPPSLVLSGSYVYYYRCSLTPAFSYKNNNTMQHQSQVKRELFANQADPPTNQATNQATSNHADPPTNQSTNPPTNQPTNQPVASK